MLLLKYIRIYIKCRFKEFFLCDLPVCDIIFYCEMWRPRIQIKLCSLSSGSINGMKLNEQSPHVHRLKKPAYLIGPQNKVKEAVLE